MSNTYTVRAYHADYNVSLLEVEARSSTEALTKALEYYSAEKQYLAPVVRIELDLNWSTEE